MKKSTVELGYAVGTGALVEIPIRHMVVCGQTQEAGKTTALEALITRSGLRAVTFVTKRGEGSFTNARRAAPYFRDNAGDWQYVAAILEASRGEKLKMERSFIIRASKGATSLAGVHTNVKRLMADPKVRGLAADMYLCLDAYLDVVVPTIARTDWAEALILKPGVNAVDLTDVPAEMQHLVIQSSIDWVLQHEADTVVVIPEAWKFVPEGRKTPVKQSAVALIRQGAALRNYVWLDSQDIGGISKEILRSCPVWLLGVQREANEVKRTLENVPDGLPKLKKTDISTLELGQFYACYGKHAIKTYVRPAWMLPDEARMVSVGRLPVTPQVPPPVDRATPRRRNAELVLNPPADYPAQLAKKEPKVNVEEANALKEENRQLRESNRQLHERLLALELEAATKGIGPAPRPDDRRGRDVPDAGPRDHSPPPAHPDARDQRAGAGPSGPAAPVAPFASGNIPIDYDTEGLYQAFKARLIAELPSDATVLHVIASRPELVVEVQRKVVTINGSDTKGRVVRLMAQGYYGEPRAVGAVRQELKRTGADPGGGGSLYDIHKALHRDGFFVLSGDKYVLAPGVKVSEQELTVA